jgi:hypothetical protein
MRACGEYERKSHQVPTASPPRSPPADGVASIPLQLEEKGGAVLETLKANARKQRGLKIWFNPITFVRRLIKQLSGQYVVQTYLVERKVRARSATKQRKSHASAGYQGGL